MRVALDGMGGDRAPEAVITGAILAAREFPQLKEIVIIGPRDLLEKELSKHKPYPQAITVYHASEVIGMNESPLLAVRGKKNSTVSTAVNLAKENRVEAIVSAGNTGAAVCAATLKLKLLKGVERPGIAVTVPTLKEPSVLIDVGANIDPKPTHLLQYGIMGDVYSRFILNKKNVKVGLLNIGEEEYKGTEFVRETHKLLGESRLQFIGNVEGSDLFTGDCDVIVCDGFVGNVALKVSEGLAETIGKLLKKGLTENLLTRVGAFLSRNAFSSLRRETDYAEYGGAPLLGINGICTICHGSSSPKAIKNAIRVAMEFINHRVNRHIVEAITNND